MVKEKYEISFIGKIFIAIWFIFWLLAIFITDYVVWYAYHGTEGVIFNIIRIPMFVLGWGYMIGISIAVALMVNDKFEKIEKEEYAIFLNIFVCFVVPISAYFVEKYFHL